MVGIQYTQINFSITLKVRQKEKKRKRKKGRKKERKMTREAMNQKDLALSLEFIIYEFIKLQ